MAHPCEAMRDAAREGLRDSPFVRLGDREEGARSLNSAAEKHEHRRCLIGQWRCSIAISARGLGG